MPEGLAGCAGTADLGEDGVRELRPRLLGPVVEVALRQTCAAKAGIRVDPEEAAALAEMAEGSGRVARAGPMRPLLVPQLESEAPVVGIHPAEAGQHADETRERHSSRLGERLGCDERGRQQLPAEREQVVERSADTRSR